MNEKDTEKIVDIQISFKGNDLLLRSRKKKAIAQIASSFQINFDLRVDGWRCRPMDFFPLMKFITQQKLLNSHDLLFKCSLFPEITGLDPIQSKAMFDLPKSLLDQISLHSFQQAAFTAWKNQNFKGLIILPTGAGKTHVGLYAISHLQVKTLIVVPTIELMNQWYERICANFALDSMNSSNSASRESLAMYVGKFGGGEKSIKPITITTYNSAFLYLKQFRNRFGLLIFDEVHHLPGAKFRAIAEGSIAPFRLGLTATLSEEEEIYSLLTTLIGPLAYQQNPGELTDEGYLAKFDHIKKFVTMESKEMMEYNELKNIYQRYLAKFKFQRNSFQQMIYRSNSDPAAKQALKAYHSAKKISFCSDVKLTKLNEILGLHPRNRIIIFSENIDFVEKISRTFLIPSLTSHTSTKERKTIMSHFRSGKYRIISTGKVLDEGVDVPDASVAIIVSGTGTPRQLVQRLGRVLRPLPGKKACLYEIVTRKTSETRISSRRDKGINS